MQIDQVDDNIPGMRAGQMRLFSSITIIHRLTNSLDNSHRSVKTQTRPSQPSTALYRMKTISQSIKHVYTVIAILASIFITRRKSLLTTSPPLWGWTGNHDFERHLTTRSTSDIHRCVRTEMLSLLLLVLLRRWGGCQYLLPILAGSSSTPRQ